MGPRDQVMENGLSGTEMAGLEQPHRRHPKPRRSIFVYTMTPAGPAANIYS